MKHWPTHKGALAFTPICMWRCFMKRFFRDYQVSYQRIKWNQLMGEMVPANGTTSCFVF